jgi:hypothetical protein
MNIKVITVVCVVFIFTSLTGISQTSIGNVGGNRSVQVVPLNFSPSDQSNMLARTGGMIEAPLKGAVVSIVNAQKLIDTARLAEWTKRITNITRLPIKIITVTGEPKPGMDLARNVLKGDNGGAVIVLTQETGQPSILLAPEEKWVIVNVSALMSEKNSKELLEERAQKELWRALAHLMGAANSTFEPCLMKPVFSLEDLDALKARSISPEPIRKISIAAKKMGINPYIMTTYRKACEEGWAPMPTNSFQKAIWEDVKAKKAAGK